MTKKALTRSTERDPVTEAAEEVVAMEGARSKVLAAQEDERVAVIAHVHEVVGRVQAASLISKFGDVTSLVWLKQIKEGKLYKQLPGVGTWETFCNYCGKSRRSVDEQIQNISVFGEQFMAMCRQFSVGYRELRKLRLAAQDGDLVIDGEFVVIGEERIPMTPEHSEDLEAAIETILEAKQKKIDEQKSTIKAKDRILKEKERVILKQEDELEKFTLKLAERNFAPGEEAFIQEIENFKTMFTGMELKLDPRNVPEDATAGMKAAWMGLMTHIRVTAQALLEEGGAILDVQDTPPEEAWVPPYEREERSRQDAASTPGGEGDPQSPLPLDESENDGLGDCSVCRFKRAMSNSKKGVKIPGTGNGKCIRPEGLCDPVQFSN